MNAATLTLEEAARLAVAADAEATRITAQCERDALARAHSDTALDTSHPRASCMSFTTLASASSSSIRSRVRGNTSGLTKRHPTTPANSTASAPASRMASGFCAIPFLANTPTPARSTTTERRTYPAAHGAPFRAGDTSYLKAMKRTRRIGCVCWRNFRFPSRPSTRAEAAPFMPFCGSALRARCNGTRAFARWSPC